MRRADLIRLAGVSADFFNSLSRRNQLPFLRRSLGVQKGWGEYPPYYAYMLNLTLALADAGSTQYEAGHLVDHHFDALIRAGLGAPWDEHDIYFGYLKLTSREWDGESEAYVSSSLMQPLCGSLPAVLLEIDRIKSKLERVSPDAIVIVNASAQLRSLRERAAKEGVREEITIPPVMDQED